MIRVFLHELKLIGEYFISEMPGMFGIYMRKKYFQTKISHPKYKLTIKQNVEFFGNNIKVGNHFSADRYCRLYSDSNAEITVGDNVSLNKNVMINARGGGKISIGNNCLIAPNVVIRSNNHVIDDIAVPIKEQGATEGYIILEDDVWIGSNAVILPNVRIGKGAVIGAGAVVTKDIEPYAIAVGVPAKKIKSRLTNEQND